MRLVAELARPGAPATRLNPVAKLAAALILSAALVVSADPVTPSVALAVELVLLPLAGIRLGALLRRSWLILVAAASLAITNAVFADLGGAVLLTAGPLRVTSESITVGLGLGLRVLAVALPGILVAATTDPTDLADSLVQQAKVPARFAIGALAAFRLLPALAAEWELLALARRARGVDAGANPLARLRLFWSTAFALLVGGIRRGTRLATAMDARGFDAGRPRTIARPQRLRPADGLLVAGAVALAAAALGASIAAGTFRPLFS